MNNTNDLNNRNMPQFFELGARLYHDFNLVGENFNRLEESLNAIERKKELQLSDWLNLGLNSMMLGYSVNKALTSTRELCAAIPVESPPMTQSPIPVIYLIRASRQRRKPNKNI